MSYQMILQQQQKTINFLNESIVYIESINNLNNFLFNKNVCIFYWLFIIFLQEHRTSQLPLEMEDDSTSMKSGDLDEKRKYYFYIYVIYFIEVQNNLRFRDRESIWQSFQNSYGNKFLNAYKKKFPDSLKGDVPS